VPYITIGVRRIGTGVSEIKRQKSKGKNHKQRLAFSFTNSPALENYLIKKIEILPFDFCLLPCDFL
jgi:hypothetical protein